MNEDQQGMTAPGKPLATTTTWPNTCKEIVGRFDAILAKADGPLEHQLIAWREFLLTKLGEAPVPPHQAYTGYVDAGGVTGQTTRY